MLEKKDCLLLLVDFQEKLQGAISEAGKTVARARVLAQGARRLGVPVLASEQNPQGLGATLPDLRPLTDAVFAKARFSAAREPLLEETAGLRQTVLLCGWETHVCVLQTALELKAGGKRPVLVEDATSSRLGSSKAAALHRLSYHGIETVTVEMALFEWLDSYQHPAFRDVLALIR